MITQNISVLIFLTSFLNHADVEVNVGVNGTEFILAADDIVVPVKVLDDGEPVLKDKIITLTLEIKAGGGSTDIFVSEATLIIRAPIGGGIKETICLNFLALQLTSCVLY